MQFCLGGLWGAPFAQANTGELDRPPDPGRAQIESLRQAILDRAEHPLDPFGLLRQKVYPSSRPISYRDLFFQATSQDTGTPLQSGYRLQKNHDFHQHFDTPAFFRFEYLGQTAHDFFIPITEALFYHGYLFLLAADGRLLFIDTHYTKPGQVEIPLFRFAKMPADFSMQIEVEGLRLGKHFYGRQELRDFAVMNQMAHSAAVNLNDHESIAKASYLVEDFYESFRGSMEKLGRDLQGSEQELLKLGTAKSLGQDLGEQKRWQAWLAKHPEHPMAASFLDSLELIRSHQQEIQQAHQDQSQIMEEQRRLLYRFKRLRSFLSLPRPQHSGLLKDALLRAAVAVEIGSAQQFLEAIYEMNHNPRVRYSTAAVTVMLAALSFPESAAAFGFESLRIAADSLQHLAEKVFHLGYLIEESVVTTLRGLDPRILHETYVADGKLDKTWTGFMALMKLGFYTIGVVHLSVNFLHLVRDLDRISLKNQALLDPGSESHRLRKQWQRFFLTAYVRPEWVGSLATSIRVKYKNLLRKFIVRQNKDLRDYLRLQEAAEEDRFDLDPHRFSLEEDREVAQILEEVKKQDFSQSRFFRFVEKRAQGFLQGGSHKSYSIRSTAAAMTHFLISFSSFTKTQNFFIWLKNKIFITANFVYRPRTWAYLIMYPRFFDVIMSRSLTKDEAGKYYEGAQMPSRLNGGMRSGLVFSDSVGALFDHLGEISYLSFLRREKLSQSLDDKAEKIGLLQFFGVTSSAQEREQRNLEEQVLAIERALEESVMADTMKALLRFSQSQEEYLLLSRSPVRDPLDPRLFSLSFRSRMFFNWYRHYAMEMEISRRLGGYVEANPQIPLATKKQYQRLRETTGFNGSDSQSLQELLFLKAEQQANKLYASFENWLMDNKHKSARSLDRRSSRQTERYVLVNQAARDPLAKGRATRSAMVNILVDKPMEVVLVFVTMAAVSSPLLMPIHDQQFSENSWNYLSRYQFLNGFMYGLLTSFLSQAWYKLQYDSRIDKLGGFDQIPTGKMAERGFWWNMMHNMRSPDNTWSKNQWYNIQMVWANMGAAIVLYAGSQFYTLGRFDLDLYFTGYAVAFFNPLMGFQLMLENAFEKSSGWVIRNIPKKYYSHPEVIKYSMQRLALLRLRYNFFFAIYENLSYFTISTFKSMSTPLLGSRSFSRVLLGGFTFTEATILSMDALAEKYPAFQGPARFCRDIFLKNYTDAERL